MRPIATDVARSVVCVSVCAVCVYVCSAKTADPIEMPFRGLLTWVQKPGIKWGLDPPTGCGIFERRARAAMRPFAKVLRTFVTSIFYYYNGECCQVSKSLFFLSVTLVMVIF